jgi:uncharacterized protein involved in exopolysaccharide biosynthesis
MTAHEIDDDYIDATAGFDAERLTATMAELRRRWPAIVGALLVGGALGYGASYAIKPTFQSSTLFIPPQQQQSATSNALASLGALSSIVGGPSAKNSIDQYVSMLQSVTVSDDIIHRFDLEKVYDTDFMDKTRKKLEKYVQITAGKKDGLIRVDVVDTDPKRAAAMANMYVVELRMMTARLALTEAQQRRMFFERLLNDTKQRLVEAQVAVEASGFTAGALKAEPKTAAEAYANVRANLTAAQVKLQVMRTTLADSSTQVQQQQQLVEALTAQLSKLEATEGAAQGSPDYIGRYRDFKYQETLFDLYSKQYEIARIDESREGAIIQVVDEATPAERKIAPRRSMFAAGGAVLALLLTVGALWRRARARLAQAV